MEEFTPIESDVEYCDQMFSNEDEIDSKITCYTIIKKPLGPQKCSILKRVTDKEAYEFNLFYKYLCMYLEGAVLDLEASDCLDSELIELKKFNKVEDCLKLYESSGKMPQLTLERS